MQECRKERLRLMRHVIVADEVGTIAVRTFLDGNPRVTELRLDTLQRGDGFSRILEVHDGPGDVPRATKSRAAEVSARNAQEGAILCERDRLHNARADF